MGKKQSSRRIADSRRIAAKSGPKVVRNIFVALFIFSLGVGLSVTSIVAALGLPPAVETGGTISGSPWTRGTVRGLIPGDTTGTSVTIGSETPTSPPGPDTTVFPNFSGLNVPVIVNDSGPIHLFGDVSIDGLTQVNGLIAGPIVGAALTPTLTVTTGANPAASTLTCSSTKIVTRVNLAASNGTVNVNGLTIQKSGTVNVNQISQIQIISRTATLATITNPATDVISRAVTYSLVNGAVDTLSIAVTMKSALSSSASLVFGLTTISTTGGATVTGLTKAKIGNTFPVDLSGCAGFVPPPPPPPAAAPPTITVSPTSIILPGSGSATAAVELSSAALNTNASAVETVSVKITNSDEPTNTFNAQLLETTASTGIFRRVVTVSTGANDASTNTLHVGACGTTPTLQVDYPTSGTPSATRSADVTCPTQSDLVVLSPATLSPAMPFSSDVVTVQGTVRNNGSNAAGTWNTVLLVDGAVTGSAQATGPLAYGATETETFTWTAAQGTHTVQVCSDLVNPGSVVESDNTNNCSANTPLVVNPKLTLNPATTPVGATYETVNITLHGELLSGTPQVKISSGADAAGITVNLSPTVAALSNDYVGAFRLDLGATNAAQNQLRVNNCSGDTATVVYPPPAAALQASGTVTTTANALRLNLDAGWSQGATVSNGADKTLLQFQARACSSSVTLNAIRFTKTGTVVNTAITNFKLELYDEANATWTQLAFDGHTFDGSGQRVVTLTTPKTITTSTLKFRLRGTLAGTQVGQWLSVGIIAAADATLAQAGAAKVNLPVSSATRSIAYAGGEQEDRAIALFGSFIPTAQASFVQTAFAAPLPVAAMTHPVTVYDDLFVRGNSATEPGNVFIQGGIILQGNLQTNGASVNVTSNLNVDANAQVTGDLQVLGAISAASFGTVLGTQIGAWYSVTGSSTASGPLTSRTITAACGIADLLTSCTGMFTGTVTTTTYEGSSLSGRTCTARGTQSVPVGTNRTLQAQAVCFNPNGNTPAGITGTSTLQNL